ncbi:MAG TPA: acyl-CoA reductase [Candidatus Limnocylindrales bacterium]|nr:acyl-CoA reductase [Candidatus Limnocylindrales bacterium]
MNLPNYFFADLPPEATLSPTMIAAACHALKRNREKFLAHRSTASIIEGLCHVAANWLEPENKFRTFALQHGPEETGFAKATLQGGLDNFFRQFTPENFHSLLEQELGHAQRLDQFVADGGGKSNRTAMVHGPEFLVHIVAGNIPNPTLMSLTLGLLTRSAQFVKCASGASFLPRLFAHSIYQAEPKLGACLEIADWRGGNRELENVLFAEADCLTATGSDETLAAIRAQLPAKVRFLGYGQRVSFGFVTREVLREETIVQVVSCVADDVIAWDQKGCLSPHVIYVEERGAVESDKFAELLAVELANRETSEPRGKISTEEAATIASRRAIYETIAVHRADAKIWSSQNSTAWTVVFEHAVRFQFSCLNRFIYVKPVPDLAAVMQGVDEIRGKVSTVGIAAPPERMQELALRFARWGATRICPLGQMQNPPLTWRHDGRPALGDLVTWMDFEQNI